MDSQPLTTADGELFEQARELLDRHYDAADHQVAAAVRGQSGRVYTGLHLGSRRVNVCAEWSAIANAVMADDAPVTAAVAVCRDVSSRVVVTNPCGVCRELMTNYAPHATVLVDTPSGIAKVHAADLLPRPWLLADEVPWTTHDPKIGA